MLQITGTGDTILNQLRGWRARATAKGCAGNAGYACCVEKPVPSHPKRRRFSLLRNCTAESGWPVWPYRKGR